MKDFPSTLCLRFKIHALAILAIGASGCCTAAAQSTNQEIRLRATVRDVVPLVGFSGEMVPVKDIDPRFALTVRIESVVPAITNFPTNSVITFAIHSPALLFGGDVVKGRSYEFSLRCRIENGKAAFSDLKVRPPQEPATRPRR